MIVSDQPLIDERTLARSTTDMPFVALETAELEELMRRLEQRDTQRWSAAVLSFLVG